MTSLSKGQRTTDRIIPFGLISRQILPAARLLQGSRAAFRADLLNMPTFAENMVTVLETRLLELAGVKETGGDGEKTVLMDLEKKWAYWKSVVAREAGTKPRVSAIDLASD